MIFLPERAAILDVIAAYSYTYDARDAEGFSMLFLEDAVWKYYLADQENPEIQLNSRQEIREWAANRLQGRAGVFISRHHQSSTVFDVLQSEYAESRTMVLVTHHAIDNPYPTPINSGVYHDTWKKTEHGWKFATRFLFTDRAP